jgi:hypothetical protein
MDLSPENFERLMNWLHPNRDEAGREYQRIRALLLRSSQFKGRSDANRLADATMDRGAEILTTEKIENWVGDKAKYFNRVGYYILLEERDRGLEMQMPDDFEVANPKKEEDSEPKSRCLEKCLQDLPTSDGRLIVRYYQGEKSIKIRERQKLARDLEMDLPSLRVKALRVRRELKKCITKCLQEAQA